MRGDGGGPSRPRAVERASVRADVYHKRGRRGYEFSARPSRRGPGTGPGRGRFLRARGAGAILSRPNYAAHLRTSPAATEQGRGRAENSELGD